MRKLGYLTVLAICCALLLSTSAFGAEGSEPEDGETSAETGEDVSDELPEDGEIGGDVSDELPEDGVTLEQILIGFATDIESLQLQNNYLQTQLSALQASLTSSDADSTLVDRQVTQSRETEKYMFQIEYNTVCLMSRRGELLGRQRALLDKRIEVEKVRRSLGEATQDSVDALMLKRDETGRQITLNLDTMHLKMSNIRTRADEIGYEFIQDYTLPRNVPEFIMSSDALNKALLKNNATLYSYGLQISQRGDMLADLEEMVGLDDETRQSIDDSIRQMNAQRRLYENQLTWTALSKYAAYTESLAQHSAYKSLKPELNEQLQLTDELYAAGEISELEKMSRQYEIYEELYSADAAAVSLHNAVCELKLLADGVVVG
jgi:hypothetical protein